MTVAIPTPEALESPDFLWLYPLLIYSAFAVFVFAAVYDTYWQRRLSLMSLMLVAGTAMWWQEWYGDWGLYIVFNPGYDLMPWGQTLWTTPHKPWFMIAAYGAYYAAGIPMGLAIVRRAQRALPKVNATLVLAAVVVPFFLVEAAVVEIPAIHFGWWTYVHHVGPVVDVGRTVYPFMQAMVPPALFVLVSCLIISHTGDSGRPSFESLFRVQRAREGWRREAARLGSWIVTFQVVYLTVVIIPVIVLRSAFGPGSAYVP